jgi:glycosyltransferase involved in cell wall biosynthesis
VLSEVTLPEIHVSESRGAPQAPSVSIVIPAYNEEEGLAADVAAVQAVMAEAGLAYELIVVDDGSEDGTGEIAEKLTGVRLVRHARNRGYGAALKTGIRHARGDIIVITDADGTYPPKHIPDLLADMERADMAVGARTGEVVKVPFFRKPAKWFLTRLAGYLAESDIPDLNSGLRAFRRSHALRFWSILPSSFSFTTTITLAMLCNGMDVFYRPIDYRERKGKSKIRPLRDTYNFLLLVIRVICYFNPLKVFLPLALLTLVGGLVKLAYNVVLTHGIADTEVMLIVAALQFGLTGLVADAVAKNRAAWIDE